MYTRLDKISRRLEWLGLTHRSSLVLALYRMADANDISALRTLAEVVEPVKDYARMNSLKGVWDFRAPLNRLVDIAHPESDKARHFRDAVQAFAGSGYKDEATEEEIRARLIRWRDNDAKLHPVLEQSFFLKELEPLSEDLSTLAAAGLLALDYLDKSTPSPSSWRAQQLALVESAKTPKADLLLMVVDPVRLLIEAGEGRKQEPGHIHGHALILLKSCKTNSTFNSSEILEQLDATGTGGTEDWQARLLSSTFVRRLDFTIHQTRRRAETHRYDLSEVAKLRCHQSARLSWSMYS